MKRLALSLMLILLGPSLVQPAVGAEVTIPDGHWIHEAEFSIDQSLYATRAHTVILDLESSGRGENSRYRNSIRWLLEKDRMVSFCIPDDESHIKKLKLSSVKKQSNRNHRHNTSGRTVLNFKRGDECQPVFLKAGQYVLEIDHSGNLIEGDLRKAFLHRPTKTQFFGSAAPSFSAPDYLVLRGPNGKIVTDNTGAPRRVLLQAGDYADAMSVWRLTRDTAQTPSIRYNFADGLGQVVKAWWSWPPGINRNLYVGEDPGQACDADHDGQFCDGDVFVAAIRIIDLGDAQLGFAVENHVDNERLIFEIKNFVVIEGGIDVVFTYTTEDISTPDAFTYDYKGYDDGSNLSLQQGEIALFSKCNFQGPATIFHTDIADLSIYNGAAGVGMGLAENSAASIKVGPDTLALLYPDKEFGGELEGIAADVACFDDPIDGLELIGNNVVSSLQIVVPEEYVVSSGGCERCVLSSVDFSDEDFTGFNFTDTIFIAATLMNTIFVDTLLDGTDFSGAATNLVGADFGGAALLCSSFSGSDLSGATFADNVLTTDQSCQLNLSGATLDYSDFDKADWRYFDLSGSNMTNVPNALSSEEDPLDLSGANLSYTTWLAGKSLDYANLGCYSSDPDATTVCPDANGAKSCTLIQGAGLNSTSLKKSCMKNALMEGVFLSFSNLDGADMSGAQLQALVGLQPASIEGAFMRDVTLSGANLTGANAKSVNFFTGGPGAVAENITAPGADFSGGYLAGANFGGNTTNLQSTKWIGALLIGANFNLADLRVNTSGGVNSGTNSSFSGAYLQGADFSSAKLEAVIFTNTYWDALGSGGSLNILVPKPNLAFPGFWKDPSLPECPEPVAYSAGNVPPPTDMSNTCPDGGPGPCDNVWDQPKQAIADSTPFKSTVVKTAPPQDPADLPQDPSVRANLQCDAVNDLLIINNPVDLCWTADIPFLCIPL